MRQELFVLDDQAHYFANSIRQASPEYDKIFDYLRGPGGMLSIRLPYDSRLIACRQAPEDSRRSCRIPAKLVVCCSQNNAPGRPERTAPDASVKLGFAAHLRFCGRVRITCQKVYTCGLS